jgi:plastocyanin
VEATVIVSTQFDPFWFRCKGFVTGGVLDPQTGNHLYEHSKGVLKHMRKLIILALALLVVVGGPSATAATRQVSIARSGFLPASVTISVGDTVTWTNQDSVRRSVVSDTGAFSSGLIASGANYSHAFPQTGTFRYRDGTRTNIRGTVIVRAAPATVTLTASKTAVIFGGEVALSGALSSKQSGQPVTLVVQPIEQSAERIQLTTAADGVWSYTAQPRIQTVYTAQYRGTNSPPVTLSVRPRMTLRKVATSRYSVSVVAARSFAGKVAYIARWSATRQRWIQAKRFVLVQSRTSATGAAATVRLKVARKTKLRAFLSQAQVQRGYVSGYSNIILS